MHFLFIDESGTPAPSNKINDSPYFVLGGIIIPEADWHSIKNDFDKIKSSFNISGEIKWRYFWSSKDVKKNNSLFHLNDTQKEELRTRLYSLLRRYSSITVISIVIDMSAIYKIKEISTQNDVYARAYKLITERFQFYLQDISRISGQKINGIIVCHHRERKDDEYLREFHENLMRGQEKHSIIYNNIIEGLFIAPSHLSVGIQFADMVAGAILRKVKNNENRFFDQISPLVRKSKSGEIWGYGINQYPTQSHEQIDRFIATAFDDIDK